MGGGGEDRQGSRPRAQAPESAALRPGLAQPQRLWRKTETRWREKSRKGRTLQGLEERAPWASPTPRTRGEALGAGAVPKLPRFGATAERPAQRDPEGRRGVREEGWGLGGGAGRNQREAGRYSLWMLSSASGPPIPRGGASY